MPAHDRPSRPPAHITIAYVLMPILASDNFYMYFSTSDVAASDSYAVYHACAVCLVNFVLSLITWRAATGSVFDLYGLFLISAYLFNGGQLFLEVFHLNEHGVLDGRFSAKTTLEAACLATMCLATLHLGALVGVVTARLKGATQPTTKKWVSEDVWTASLVGWGLFWLSVVPMVYVMGQALSVALQSGYQGLYEGKAETGLDAGPMLIANCLIPAIVFILSGSRSSRVTVNFAMGCMGAYFVTLMMMGLRGHAVTPLIASFWIYDRRVRRLPRAPLVSLGLLVLLVVFPLIRLTRDTSGSEKYSASHYLESYFSIDNPATSVVGEMGSTLATIAHTIELVPAKRPYDMGVGYLYDLLTILPNIFGDLHPTVARGIPSYWLIWEVNSYVAVRGGSLGYSFIAEAYLNFGWIGAPLVVFFFGLGFASLQLWADRSGGPLEAAAVACCMSSVLFFARAEATFIVRPLVWYTLIPYLLARTISKLRVPGRVSYARIGSRQPASTDPTKENGHNILM
jgi:oligosaccharide repeat unit polymerase